MSQTGSAERVWRKSTRCESQHCVEVAQVDNGAAVRDSVDPERSLLFGASAWRAFVDGLRAA
ncbi:DUF397 domain-containing protein [Plantactinospora endophytica]|uniref:DUF397 domain-containing protein n=1 Tax=Plantactinospora endophytica TaxID=673535 RepID=A0ABQ4EC69_9ACTN|nr:DUF397 domain-containing protein [Plantactinospora endophytica]GIG91861.1 hypothetical protein Pen02_67970 [Plantactinospora endophytica]